MHIWFIVEFMEYIKVKNYDIAKFKTHTQNVQMYISTRVFNFPPEF
jgi:hypothetical protein